MRDGEGLTRRTFLKSACAAQAGLIYGGCNSMTQSEATSSSFQESLKKRLACCLDDWCHWLTGYLWQVPGADALCTMNPTLGTGRNPYRDVAGNQFAAAAAAYWLCINEPSSSEKKILEGLIRLALGTHLAAKQIDRPDIQKWGASYSSADNWHACLFSVTHAILQPAANDDFSEKRDAIYRWEADHLAEYGISKNYRSWPGLWPESSCGESNAWSACHLQFTRYRLNDQERDRTWMNAAIDRSLNALSMQTDLEDKTLIHGQPLCERVKEANFEPGGIQEHHGFYHPGYIAWPLAYLALAELADRNLDTNKRTGVFLHNWKTVFNRLKQSTFCNGRLIHCAGDDWAVYGYGNSLLLPAVIFAAVEWQDADAAQIADEWLKLIEYQQSLSGGSVQAARQKTLQRTNLNDFSWYEAIDGACLAMAHWMLCQPGMNRIPEPSNEETYNLNQQSLYHAPNACLVWSRTQERWASMSWRSAYREWQAVIQPIHKPHMLKFNHNGIGIFETNKPDWYAKLKDKSLPNVTWHKIQPLNGNGFWSLGCIELYGKSAVHGTTGPLIKNYQALVALSEGPCLWVEFVETLDQVFLRRSASLGLQLAADIFNGNKARIQTGNRKRYFEPHPYQDTWIDLDSRSVTLDGDMHIQALWGEGTFHLLQKRQRDPEGERLLYENDPVGASETLLAHALYFGMQAYKRPIALGPGTILRDTGLFFSFGREIEKSHTKPEGKSPYLRAIQIPGSEKWIVLNFNNTTQTLELPGRKIEIEPQAIQITG